MGFWNHLIMNHLMLANHASWARWLRLRSPERATDLLEIIHTGVCGPMSVKAHGKYRYFLNFTDDLSRYGYIYLMKHKSETFEKFKEFQSEVENHRNKKIKFIWSDRGGKYLSYEFGLHLKQHGIVSQLTPPGTPREMVCPNVVTILYWIWCDLWCLLPIYRYRFGVML